MITAFLAAAVFASPVDEYFPLVPGTRRTYEESLDGRKSTTTDEVGAPVDFGGKPATPVVTRDGAAVVSTVYYRTDGDTIYQVGEDPAHPMPKPIPLIMFDGRPGRWDFAGATSSAPNSPNVLITGRVEPKGDRSILGRKTSVIEVTLVTVVDAGLLRARGEQTSLYAKGIGLVESVTKQKEGRKETRHTLKLIKLEEAKSSG